jgi:hypothetical protein
MMGYRAPTITNKGNSSSTMMPITNIPDLCARNESNGFCAKYSSVVFICIAPLLSYDTAESGTYIVPIVENFTIFVIQSRWMRLLPSFLRMIECPLKFRKKQFQLIAVYGSMVDCD